ncbi:MAG: DMT family transporter [Pseudomonadota bacterium]
MTDPQDTPPATPFLLCLLAIFIASGLDAGVKAAALTFPLLTVIFWRYLCGVALLLPVYLGRARAPLTAHNLRLHAFRGAAQAATAVTYFYALTKIGLAEATVIAFTAGLWVVPLSALILGERVRIVSVIAIAIGFTGAVIAVSGQPLSLAGGGERTLGIVAATLSAVTYALTLVLMRLQTRTDDALSILTYSNIVPAVLIAPLALSVDTWPGVGVIPVGAVVAVFGITVWWLFTLAYAKAEAQQLAPIDYTALLWSALFGYLVFNETPGWQLYAGAVLIIASCLTVTLRRRRRPPGSGSGSPEAHEVV